MVSVDENSDCSQWPIRKPVSKPLRLGAKRDRSKLQSNELRNSGRKVRWDEVCYVGSAFDPTDIPSLDQLKKMRKEKVYINDPFRSRMLIRPEDPAEPEEKRSIDYTQLRPSGYICAPIQIPQKQADVPSEEEVVVVEAAPKPKQQKRASLPKRTPVCLQERLKLIVRCER